ncbi:hypothetical protein U472_13255 [Orenia metallireducens]|uniref:Uncharacterized protein n=1 Tax=Orenia metallireducens TaxID=1413210 RepID=A0A1C0A5C6_9FIRM|nr:hypothetical protein [Orenia metallireducens]OCL25319.1 hypothetical protein U472_13255 [Orenia metallireducens]
MRKQQRILSLIVILSLSITIAGCINKSPKYTIEDVRTKIGDYLYEKYGEEFIVDRIGARDDDGVTEYVARIYPQSIVGTIKENDKYYYGSATIDVGESGELVRPGDSYSYVKMNLTGEEYLLPKAKEIFGDRVLLKVDSELKIWGREEIIVREYRRRDKDSNGVDSFIGYKESDFKKARKRVVNHPEHNRLELELYLYVFDQIEDKSEKEERRKDIFEFVQYLKEEDLFNYLELGVIFIDERVLAPSYPQFKQEINKSDLVKKKVEGEIVLLPPIELRRRISTELQKEIDKMSEKELLANMRSIRKSELSYRGIREYNGQYQSWIYSIGMLEERYKSSITKEDREKKYDRVGDINLSKYQKYIYIN